MKTEKVGRVSGHSGEKSILSQGSSWCKGPGAGGNMGTEARGPGFVSESFPGHCAEWTGGAEGKHVALG